jgi:EmrB/QacA subfamily drug resistance transporter
MTAAPTLPAPPVDAGPGATLSPTRRNLVLAVMCLAVLMVVASVTMLANALPAVSASLGASQSEQQWIVDAYGLTLAALLLPAGALGDRYGRRGALVIGFAIFGGASLVAVGAGSPTQLIALRALMGIGAALVMPGTLSTITSIFPAEERAKAVGIWAGFAGIGGTLGLLIAGVLLESFSWASVFVATAVLALALLAAVVAVVPATVSSHHVGLDPLGALLSAAGIGALVFGIIEGPDQGWTNPVTIGALVGGVALLAAFVAAELRSEAPLLDPRFFRHRGFTTGSVSVFLQFFAMFGFFFVALQFLQLVLGYSTLMAAVAMVPMSIVMIPLSAVAGTLADRRGHRVVGGAGLAISALGLLLFTTLGPDSGYLQFLVASLVLGVGAPLAMTPATTAIVASLPLEKQGVASAVNDTAREVGAAFGVAVLGSAFNVAYRGSIDQHLSGLPTDLARQAREAPALALQVAQRAGGNALVDATKDAFTVGMRWSIGLGAVLLLAGALLVWFRGASREQEVVEDEIDVSAERPQRPAPEPQVRADGSRRTRPDPGRSGSAVADPVPSYATVVPYISSNGSEMSSSRSPSGPEK